MPLAPLLSRFLTAVICGLWGLCALQWAHAVPPTGITLSSSVAYEWCPPFTVVGTLSAVDSDPGDTHTFSLVSGAGSTHNNGAHISGNQLQLRYGFDRDFEVWGAVNLLCRVRVTDSTGLTYEQPFVVVMLDDRNEDFDGDGLTEAQEEDVHFTSDLIYDFDGDGVGDGADLLVVGGIDDGQCAAGSGRAPLAVDIEQRIGIHGENPVLG